MSPRVLLALTLLTAASVGWVTGAGGPPAPDKKAAEEIDLLINQLGSSRPEEREAAAKKLAERDDALPALRKAMAEKDPEVRRRATALAETIAARIKDGETATLLADVNREGLDRFIDRMVNTKGYATEERWELTR